MAAGVALGQLLAPNAGENTRNEISDLFNDAFDKSKGKAQIAGGILKDYGNGVAERAK